MQIIRLIALVLLSTLSLSAQAVDSYRYLHVTIETPWMIFLFLLPIVLSPFILMAILYWRFAGRKEDEKLNSDDDQHRE